MTPESLECKTETMWTQGLLSSRVSREHSHLTGLEACPYAHPSSQLSQSVPGPGRLFVETQLP